MGNAAYAYCLYIGCAYGPPCCQSPGVAGNGDHPPGTRTGCVRLLWRRRSRGEAVWYDPDGFRAGSMSKTVCAGKSRCVQKYYQLLPALCRAAGVHPLWLEPYVLGEVAFCGSLGWYDYSLRNVELDTHITVQDYRRKTFQDLIWNDGRFVHWLAAETSDGTRKRLSDEAITAHMVQALAQQLQDVESHVQHIVGVTHMLPFRSMMHYRHEARADYFGAFMGSVLLGEVWQSCPKVTLVLAGHTHRQITVQVGRMTAFTSPVGYARQWDGSPPYAVARDRLRVIDLTVKERA
jgi:hypothetical protein